MLGRADDMLSVRGVNVYPSAIDDLIRSVTSIVEYEVEIRRVSEMDDLLLKIETDGRRLRRSGAGNLRRLPRAIEHTRQRRAGDGGQPAALRQGAALQAGRGMNNI